MVSIKDSEKIKRGPCLELGYLHGGEVVYQPGDSLGPRVLYDFELVYIIEGTVIYESDGQSYTVEPGGFILGRPGFKETYHWDAKHRTRHAFFHFYIEGIPTDWPDSDDWSRVWSKPASLCTRLFRHILQHIYEHGGGPDVRPSLMDCRLVSVLLDAADMFATANSYSLINYDALLISWGAQTVQSDVTFTGSVNGYCLGASARYTLISAMNWDITDSGKSASCVNPDIDPSEFVITVKTDNTGSSSNTQFRNQDTEWRTIMLSSPPN